MKKFSGNKRLAEIKAQCKQAGIQFDDARYKRGDDYVVIRTTPNDNASGIVLYNTFNGNFTGTTDKGVNFDSRSDQHENEPWFQALLSFFYVEKADAPAAG